jgi:hypothetical protein
VLIGDVVVVDLPTSFGDHEYDDNDADDDKMMMMMMMMIR